MDPLTLRRVPPNLLVSQGATDFAVEMGMPILPHDALISPAAKERWIRWRSDLRSAERKSKRTGAHPSCWKVRDTITPETERAQERKREQHTQNLLRAYPSLLQSPSPPLSDDLLYEQEENAPSDASLTLSGQSSSSWVSSDEQITTPNTSNQSTLAGDARPPPASDSSRNAFINSTQKVPTLQQYRDNRALPSATYDRIMEDEQTEDVSRGLIHVSPRKTWADGSGEESDSATSAQTVKDGPFEEPHTGPVDASIPETAPPPPKPVGPVPRLPKEDHITDTVGAIAIDSWGNIACGASSGGIGMKYRGRVGPAALVGVGAAVIPIDPDDPEQTCVATVTSGTGEHMATTMAATVCAERLYQSVKKNRGGDYVECTEDEALQAMIENEFMGKANVSRS
jgi:taspase (threonine aspartase 1)